ncbi:phosphotransferase family protein [Loigolactobacillus jiayinensis]|uniref:Phosphotransferase family protein n=1 Tax=Loigolactobacillus jiayinensis TaxID=2486016 RepID=A0ABW1RCM4_9LACO|nr:aminoglycoside phosphotransferase family protein [Loigolactobacillus jiayinensis]
MTSAILTKIKDYLNQPARQTQLKMAPIQTVTFLAQGEYNRNFLVTTQEQQKFVFRLNYGSQIEVTLQARYEYHALTLLKASQRTPKPLYLDDSQTYFKHDVLLEAFLPGRPLVYQTDLPEAAAIFAAIHQLPVSPKAYDYLKTEIKLCTARIDEASRLLQPVQTTGRVAVAQVNLLLALQKWCQQHNQDDYFAQQPTCLVNTEVNSHNFLITADYGWLIDWEKPVISNAVQDLSQFLAETTTLWRSGGVRLTDEQVTAFIARYAQLTGQQAPQLQENLHRYMPFLLLRALSWCGMLVATYADKPIKNPEIYQRCQAFLQPSFMVPLLAKYGVPL